MHAAGLNAQDHPSHGHRLLSSELACRASEVLSGSAEEALALYELKYFTRV